MKMKRFHFHLCYVENSRQEDNEIIPVKVQDFRYIYALKLPALSINMCGKDLFIVFKRVRRSSQKNKNLRKL